MRTENIVQDLALLSDDIKKGGDPKYHEKNSSQGKLFVRDRIKLLCDEGSFQEDGLYANCTEKGLAADGVLTGLGRVGGRLIAVMANDSTVKAGSWGALTVEKMLRIQEKAKLLKIPVFYLVDSAGARITDQVEMFPGRRGAGRIFYQQSNLSGMVPQICLLFGPSAAGGAYIPAFCDIVILVDGNASMYLGSPRMAESVIGEKVTLEEMGGARMHCTMSGCGDFLVKTEEEAISVAKRYFSYMPDNFQKTVPISKVLPQVTDAKSLESIIPSSPARVYDMRLVLNTILDSQSFFEIKELYAPEILTGFGRISGISVGIIANQPMVKGGVLFAESANKAARAIQICNSFNVPILFLADVPGFMVGSKVEKEGIIRAGAKMIHALSTARVPKLSLIVRKAYGAGLYAMSGPAFESGTVLALPTAQIAVMGPEPAVNAVYYNKLVTMDEQSRKKFIYEKVAEYNQDVNLVRLASELIIDHIVNFSDVRNELSSRLKALFECYSPVGVHRPILPM